MIPASTHTSTAIFGTPVLDRGKGYTQYNRTMSELNSMAIEQNSALLSMRPVFNLIPPSISSSTCISRMLNWND